MQGIIAQKENNLYDKLFEAANTGKVQAQYDFALFLYEKSSRQDFFKAREYFQNATVHRHKDATYYLAIMYLKGEGGKTLPISGLRLLNVYKQTHIDSLNLLCHIYLEGSYNIEKDLHKAKVYLEMAYELGSNYAAETLGMLSFKGLKGYIDKNHELGLKCFKEITDPNRRESAKQFISDFFLKKKVNSLREQLLLSLNEFRVIGELIID